MKTIITVLTFVLITSGATFAQTTKYIGMKKARAIAMSVASGKIQSAEREREHGKMIYSFDIRLSDGRINEVGVDAITGKVIENKIETAADEAAEKAADTKKKN
ncbi:MAG: PepSY domain-containing protein [Pyrinomonadaceae bacterium]